MRFFDAFSGYGGFHLGIERAYDNLRPDELADSERPKELHQFKDKQFKWECVGYSEIDKYASAVYKYHFGGTNYGDITKIDPTTIPDFDLFCGGFPCQAFSIAGKRGGFDDTRGTLIYDVFRILKEKQPKFVLLENVKGLLSHDSGRTFKTIISSLAELGYSVEWQVLNAKNFGVPQNRERVFIVGHLGGFGRRQVFPIRESNPKTLIEHTKQVSQGYRVYDQDGIATTQASQAGGLGAKTGLYATPKIRRLTCVESERLMGLPDGWTKYGDFDGETKEISDTQRYKLCGNGVVVNCVEEIIKRLCGHEEEI